MKFKGTSFKVMLYTKLENFLYIHFRIIPWWMCADKSNFHTMWMWKDDRDKTINYYSKEDRCVKKLPYEMWKIWKSRGLWMFFKNDYEDL